MGAKDRIEVAELSQGDVFGEMAALTDEPSQGIRVGESVMMVQNSSQRTINDQFLKNGDAMEAFAAFMHIGKRAVANSPWIRPKPMSSDLVERMRRTLPGCFQQDDNAALMQFLTSVLGQLSGTWSSYVSCATLGIWGASQCDQRSSQLS